MPGTVYFFFIDLVCILLYETFNAFKTTYINMIVVNRVLRRVGSADQNLTLFVDDDILS